MTTSLIILAGGASSRMKNSEKATGMSEAEVRQANIRSKSLISIDPKGRPLMDYLLYNARAAGLKNIYILTGEDGSMFRDFYGKKDNRNEFHGLQIHFATQYIPEARTKPFGTCDAVYQTLEQYPDLNKTSYLVCNSDNLYSVAAFKMLLSEGSPNALIGYDRDGLNFSEERISKFALIKLNAENYVVDIVEKPLLEEISGFKDQQGVLRVSMNVFKFDGAMFYEYAKNCPVHPVRNEKELPTALLRMIEDHPDRVKAVPLREHVPDLTAKEDIAIFKKYLEEHQMILDW